MIGQALNIAINKIDNITVDDIASIIEDLNNSDIRQLNYIFDSVDIDSLIKVKKLDKESYKRIVEEIENTTNLNKNSIVRSLTILFVALIKMWIAEEQSKEFSFCSGIKLISGRKNYEDIIRCLSQNKIQLFNDVDKFLSQLYKVKQTRFFEVENEEYEFIQSVVLNSYLKNEANKQTHVYKRVLKVIEELAEINFEIAQNAIAFSYFNGLGKEKNYKKAIEWYSKSSEQGSVDGMYGLIDIYTEVTQIDEINKKTIIEWCIKAAENGDSKAQFNLFLMYAIGYGVKCDSDYAMYWLRKAADQGHIAAKNLLNSKV